MQSLDLALEPLLSMLRPGARTLHLGCGNGQTTNRIAQQVGATLGVELELSVRRERSDQLLYVCATSDCLPVASGWAQAIVAQGTIHIGELRRVSREDTIWILFVRNKLRDPSGVELEEVREWVADRETPQLYSVSVLAQRQKTDDVHMDPLLMMDETLCVVAGPRR